MPAKQVSARPALLFLSHSHPERCLYTVDNFFRHKAPFSPNKAVVFLQHFVKKKSFPIHIYSQILTTAISQDGHFQLLQFYSRLSAGIKYHRIKAHEPIPATQAGQAFAPFWKRLKIPKNRTNSLFHRPYYGYYLLRLLLFVFL